MTAAPEGEVPLSGPCRCGRGDVVAAVLHHLGGRIVLIPLTATQALAHAADWRCPDCIADASRELLNLTPVEALGAARAVSAGDVGWLV